LTPSGSAPARIGQGGVMCPAVRPSCA
jgi:hypothetical protein